MISSSTLLGRSVLRGVTTTRQYHQVNSRLYVTNSSNKAVMKMLASSSFRTATINKRCSTSSSFLRGRRKSTTHPGCHPRRRVKSTVHHHNATHQRMTNSTSIIRARINHFLNQQRTVPIPRWISPQHATMSFSECSGHVSFLLVAISYAVEDFLHLRILAIAGSSMMLVFTYFHPHGRVLFLPFRWNLLFIGLNSYRVAKSYINKWRADQLSPLMNVMHDHHFYVMEKEDFAALVRLGTVESLKSGDMVVAQEADNRYIRLVLRGELIVDRDGQTTYLLHQGNFISEVGLHAGLLLRGNVSSCCNVRAGTDDVLLLRWDRTELMHLLEINMNIQRAIKAVMSWDIVSKLKSQRGLLASGKIVDPEEWTKKRREQTLHRYKAILHNVLMHPQYLNKRKEELHKYRDIHHIDDSQHRLALREMGWSLTEFEVGRKEGQIDEDVLETKETGWKWYAQDLYFRMFG